MLVRIRTGLIDAALIDCGEDCLPVEVRMACCRWLGFEILS
jgi:hypothetical protein